VVSGDRDEDLTRTQITIGKGTEVDHYRIIEKIGAGGMGEVYLAEDTKLNRRVALKFLPVHMSDDADVRARFTREAQAAAKLDHPNIVTIHEVGEHNGRPFFAMQYIDGKTLHAYCHDEPLPISRIVHLMLQVSEGLAGAHAVGVTHRDIKSANIIVDGDFRPKILDFGLATIQGGEMLTRAGSTLGTVAYMSPEQAQGREADHRSDLFSLGVVFYELICGRTPFRRNNDAATLHAIVSETPEPLARYKSDVPPELQRMVDKTLAKNPSERYQSAADLAADLRSVSQTLDSGEHKTTGWIAVSRPSIAVLPFTNMSADPENEYFSDGLTEELLNVLAKNPELKVTGRTSSFAFKGKQEDIRGIGQKLGVEMLLEGSVRKAGNRVRITAQLVGVADGFHLWSETYDRVLDDIFAVQDDIAKSVSAAMNVTLVGVSEVKKVVNPESYAMILRAHHSAVQMTSESLAVAVELYSKAIEIDPDNARAWAGLAKALGHQVAYGHAEHAAVFTRAKAAAEKAVALDDMLPDSHAALGFVYAALELRMAEAGREFARAYGLAPNDSSIVGHMALWEMVQGNSEQALRLARKSVELDPLSPWARRELCRVLTVSGQLDEARQVMQRVIELSPETTTVHLGLSWIALLQGRFDDALSEAGKEKVAGYRFCGKAMAAHGAGLKADSDRYLALLVAEGEQWSFQIACVHAYRGEVDQAFAALECAYQARDSGIPLTRITPFMKTLHSDPRWPVLLKKIGLAD
jgi:serine/threonine protein kinase/Flp pilus assembly protein TadD